MPLQSSSKTDRADGESEATREEESRAMLRGGANYRFEGACCYRAHLHGGYTGNISFEHHYSARAEEEQTCPATGNVTRKRKHRSKAK